jgi:hypothetical protein
MLLFKFLPLAVLTAALVHGTESRDWRRSALTSPSPDTAVLRQDIDGDGKADILERWWNGKRVRWLDENRDLRPGDTRGDLIADVLQIDMDGDGSYDGWHDMNIKWVDRDNDGVADVQAFAHNPARWTMGRRNPAAGSHWMLFINHDNRGVLGWMDWTKWDFDCWGYSGEGNWLPNYHDGDFVKIHQPPFAVKDPRLNWENPFSFFDMDGDGLNEMALRWCSPHRQNDQGEVTIDERFNEAFVTYDLDNDSSKGNEVDFDLTLRAVNPSIGYGDWKHAMPGLKGDPRFDACFQFNNWRRIDEIVYIPRAEQYDTFFRSKPQQMWLVFDEDDDDRRWERVEMMYPVQPNTTVRTNPWSAKHFASHSDRELKPGETPGLAIHCQSDSLGDRGEFDEDNSGDGRLYIGRFDRKLHLYGAEWGAWTVDRGGRFHGGWGTPTPQPVAKKVEEVVRYTDTDKNGFIDRIEFDYDGDQTIDLTVNLLDWKTAENPEPDRAELLDARVLGWKGLHDQFKAMAEKSWQEALLLYRAAWRRGLTDDVMDRLAVASSFGERYDHAWWLKETLLRTTRAQLRAAASAEPAKAEEMKTLERELIRAIYLGDFAGAAAVIERLPPQ